MSTIVIIGGTGPQERDSGTASPKAGTSRPAETRSSHRCSRRSSALVPRHGRVGVSRSLRAVLSLAARGGRVDGCQRFFTKPQVREGMTVRTGSASTAVGHRFRCFVYHSRVSLGRLGHVSGLLTRPDNVLGLSGILNT